MSHPRTHEAGFSAVELLITLFIAVAFLVTGYQLYSLVVSDSGEARFRAKASNIAYENLRRAAAVTSACSTSPANTIIAIPAGHGLDRPTMTRTISAPKGCTAGGWIMKAEITVSYYTATNQLEEVRHALYVER